VGDPPRRHISEGDHERVRTPDLGDVTGVTGHCSDVSRVRSTQNGSGPVFCNILLFVRERRESVVGNTQGSSYKNTGSCETQIRTGVDGPESLGRDSDLYVFVWFMTGRRLRVVRQQLKGLMCTSFCLLLNR
jgi:hypothetical protein